MKTILLMHGPNLNKLGERDPTQYGTMTLPALEAAVQAYAATKDLRMVCFQSNHEGALIDTLQNTHADGLIINAGALTHYSYALYDAIVDSQLPAIEVHLSNIQTREPWRQHSVIAPACVHTIMGKKLDGYFEAVDFIKEALSHGH